ncbi:MAG: GGDEF domain-containing protein [Candidatus Woesearchaeota archaeon]
MADKMYERIMEKLDPEEREYLQKFVDNLEELGNKDSLTKLYNKKKFYEDLESAISEAERENSDLVLFMMDIDNFKQYNDSRGHVAGDKELKSVADSLRKNVAKCLTRSLRKHERNVYRFGGEEIGIVIPKASLEHGLVIGERLRKGVEKECGVTISVGAASYRPVCRYLPGSKAEQLVEDADSALYISKTEGRNRVSCHNRSRPTLRMKQ